MNFRHAIVTIFALTTALYLGACSLDAVRLEPGQSIEGAAWRELLPRTPLLPHACHPFEEELAGLGEVTHARLNIFPDGGIARLRLFGRPR